MRAVAAAADRIGAALAAFFIVLLVSIAAASFVTALLDCAERVWTVLYFDVPGTIGGLLTVVAVSPLFGLVVAVALGWKPLLLGATLAAAATVISPTAAMSRTSFAAIACLWGTLFVHILDEDAAASFQENVAGFDPGIIPAAGPPWSTLVAGPSVLAIALFCSRFVLVLCFGRRPAGVP